MGAIGGEDLKKWEKMQGAALGSEKKILVLVRLRPLSEKEITRNEVSNGECINETTILYRNGLDCQQLIQSTIESLTREFIGKDNKTTLSASVNFINLAKSERASQVVSVGQRLKEGCHINRTLLTLGTVIHKLSFTAYNTYPNCRKGIHGHVNYRDSKLTRILQPALRGNARTVIIFTLGTARSHVEKSQNTLLFACCAKKVTTNAQVNVVMSDKALVKHLQKKLAD
ncbi:Kinesin-like protein NACK2 [Capsicum baccatum]|uniref:Kinesin-like protein NACK2 n=1 Tax=Capsicum baccatum TaxID=33114 RepID=A0A2G2VV41_CAPBA|nr:Kinesin-like protein NACK2 [Capsicum baccatum]